MSVRTTGDPAPVMVSGYSNASVTLERTGEAPASGVLQSGSVLDPFSGMRLVHLTGLGPPGVGPFGSNPGRVRQFDLGTGGPDLEVHTCVEGRGRFPIDRDRLCLIGYPESRRNIVFVEARDRRYCPDRAG